MSAENELLHTYRHWRRLVQTETKAIQSRNWPLFSDCHLAIQTCQSRAVDLTRETRAEWQLLGVGRAEKEAQLRLLVSDLIELTRQNHHLLQHTLAAARKQLDRIGEAGHNLKRIRRSYGYFPVCSRRA